MKKIDRRIIVIAAFIFIVGLSYGVMKFLIAQKEEPVARGQQLTRRVVKVEEVKYGTIISPVTAPGRISSVAQIDLVAEASGKISTSGVSLKEGASFKKGDILFTIYRDEAALALKGKKSQFMHTLAGTLPDIKIDFPYFESTFTDFFAKISISAPLPDFPEITDSKLKIFLASRNVLNDYYSIQKDELQLGRHTIRAPFNGSYAEVFLEEGAYTNTGGKVARAIQSDRLEIEVPVRKSDAAWIKPGDKVILKRGNETHRWEGTVVRKGGFVDEQTQSQSVFIAVANDRSPYLLPGEYLSATFPGHPVNGVIEIPRSIVFNSDEIFVVNDGRLLKKRLNVIKVNERTLVANGIEEGSKLVVQPLINVQEGTPVEIFGEEVKPEQMRGEEKGDGMNKKSEEKR